MASSTAAISATPATRTPVAPGYLASRVISTPERNVPCATCCANAASSCVSAAAQILSVENLMARNLGTRVERPTRSSDGSAENIDAMDLLDEQKQALKANLAVMNCIDGQVDELERSILTKVKLREDYQALKTVSGIGEILAMTIALEVGRHRPFRRPRQLRLLCPHGGQPARIERQEEGRRQRQVRQQVFGVGVHRSAHFAVRYDATIKRWYQKKCASSLSVVAIKAVAHKLARACYHVIKDGTPFDAAKAFG